MRHRKSVATAIVAGALILPMVAPLNASASPLRNRGVELPEWVKPAVTYLVSNGLYDKSDLRIDKAMSREDFKTLLEAAFGASFKRDKGKVTAFEVSRTLVKALGKKDVVTHLASVTTPDGWSPEAGKKFGYEVVARSLGLRHDRSTSEENLEASSGDTLTQGDVLWAVWQAKTSPDTYTADALADFDLADLDAKQKRIVKFAFSLVGTPYVWGGEWTSKTPSGYPYGAQAHGGVDCSGFTWYVMRAKVPPGWVPTRPYEGFSLAERSSAQMAAAIKSRDRLRVGQLQPTDLVFFAPGGVKSDSSSVYHVGIYLGNGWMIDSSGSKDGVSLDYMGPGSWYRGQLAWGRRIS